jgi:hypothetical protein
LGSKLPCDNIDKSLFQAATEIVLGDGKKALFWDDNWLSNKCPKQLAPRLFSLAKRKRNSVHHELTSNNWIFSFRQITTIEEIHELISLGALMQNVQLVPSVPDDIRWRFSSNGIYTSKSAYLLQFQGTFATTDFMKIWSALAEPKHHFLGWLILHQKNSNRAKSSPSPLAVQLDLPSL